MSEVIQFPNRERYEVAASVSGYTIHKVTGAARLPIATYASLTELASHSERLMLQGTEIIWDEPTRRTLFGPDEPEGAA